jgi:hypothetical protein
MSLPSKLSRAIAAYLRSVGIKPAGGVHPCFSQKDRAFPNVTIVPRAGSPKEINTGNRSYQVEIWVRASAADSGGGDDAQRVAFDALCDSVCDAMMQTEDNQTLDQMVTLINQAAYAAADKGGSDADLSAFTILEYYDAVDGPGRADEEGTFWEMVYIFNITCCASQLSGYS